MHLRSLTSSAARLAALALAGSAAIELRADDTTEESAVALEQFVVTAAGFEQQIRNAPASISLISRTELTERRVNNLAEALSDIEGIDVGDSAGKTGGLDISIRGMPSDYTLFLVDGRRQNAAGNVTPNGFGGTSTSFLPPPAAIERIEVVRGPMSTLYGSDAMGGVVNIITRRVDAAWNGTITAGGTLQENRDFGDSLSGQLYLSGPVIPDVLGLTLRGSAYHRMASELEYFDENGDAIEVSRRGPSPVEADINSYGGRLTLVALPEHDFWIDYDRSEQTYDNSEGQLGTLGVRGYAPEQRFNRTQVTAAHTWRHGNGSLETSVMQNNTETIGRILPDDTATAQAGDPRELTNDNLVVDSKYVTQIGDAHTLTVGGQWWDAEMVDGVAPAPYTHTQWALFAEDEWLLRPDLRLTLGFRHDDHSAFGEHTSPRAYLVWNVSDAWTVRTGISQGFKVPRLDQLADGITGFRGQGTIPFIGTPTLSPETSTTTELGFAYAPSSNFSAGVTFFRNDFDDKIATGEGLFNCSFAGSPDRPGCVDYGYWPAVDLYSQSVNIDKAITQGAEFSSRIRFATDWTASANYTYTDSEQKSGADIGQPLTNTPRHMLNARLRWDGSERFSAWISGEYRSERLRSDGAARDLYGDYRAYTLFHLGGAYTVTDQITLNATVSNLFDKDFIDYRPYDNNGSVAYTNLFNNHQEPRRLWMSATYTF
ncbi:TonB-dependent receptor domain-containing protein [Actomonas aquatica]|uniref:TonB-dependent receptor n=1 Tax=Actomonas aquatica TaxID=2866162 RepID=A0ABZ1C5A2_9BACT|nr:TonB-dependent receptor [Opitutus sp. WL0086]WRQ86906.1 TonB-dependent receptor [Opitutus sp. WL0086]